VTPSDLEKYLHEHIPLSAAMQVRVEEACEERVVLGAPLPPNINHRDTVFGGSASALAILSAWSLLHTRLTAAGCRTRLVIQRNTMSYEQAIAGDFTARAQAPGPEAWQAFTRMLERKGRARITVRSTLWHEGHEAGRFEGEFVALGTAEPDLPAKKTQGHRLGASAGADTTASRLQGAS
jgi:thioesterase domain-containing protein